MKKEAISLLLIFLVIFGLRLNSSTEVLKERDESVYFIVAQDIVNGGVPYKTSWDHKGPVLYFILVPIIKLFGNSIFILRIFTTVYLLVSMLFVYLISKRFFGKGVSLIPPLIYGLFFTTSDFGGLASNAEIFMMLPAIMANYCLINYMQNNRHSFLKLCLCGFFSGLAIFIKTVAFFTVVICPLILVLEKFKTRRYNSWDILFEEMFAYLLGSGITILIILSYFTLHDALIEFYNAYFLYNYYYVRAWPIKQSFDDIFFFFRWFLKSDKLAILTLFSLLFIALKRKYTKYQKYIVYYLTGLTCFSLAGVWCCRRMYQHYFLQMALPFSILIGFAIFLLEISKKAFNKIIFIGVIIATVIVYNQNRIVSFLTNYKNQRNNVYYKIAEYILANTTEQDTIYIVGEPIIYFLLNRKLPTKFFWSSCGDLKGILNIKDSVLSAFSNNKPKYIIRYNNFNIVEHIDKFILVNYHLETSFENVTLYRAN